MVLWGGDRGCNRVKTSRQALRESRLVLHPVVPRTGITTEYSVHEERFNNPAIPATLMVLAAQRTFRSSSIPTACGGELFLGNRSRESNQLTWIFETASARSAPGGEPPRRARSNLPRPAWQTGWEIRTDWQGSLMVPARIVPPDLCSMQGREGDRSLYPAETTVCIRQAQPTL